MFDMGKNYGMIMESSITWHIPVCYKLWLTVINIDIETTIKIRNRIVCRV